MNNWLSRKVVFAYYCQEYKECHELLEQLGDKFDTKALTIFVPDLPELRAECVAMLSDKSESMYRARRLERAEKFAQASRAYKRILDGLDSKNAAYAFAEKHAYISDVQLKLATGVKVELPMKAPDSLHFWRDTEKPLWKQSDECLEFSTQKPERAWLFSSCKVSNNIRVKLEWNCSGPTKNAPPWYIHLSMMPWNEGGYFGLQLFPHDGRIQIGSTDWRLNESVRRNLDLSPDVWHTCIVERRGNSISVEHDGKPVITNFEDKWNSHGRPTLILNAYPNTTGYSLRLRDITVEQLPE